MDVWIGFETQRNVVRQPFIGLYNGVCRLSFGFPENTHKSDIYIKIAQAFGDVSRDAGPVLLDDDHGVEFSREIYLYLIDPDDPDLPAADGFSAHGHHAAICIFHTDVNSVGIDIRFRIIWDKRKCDPLFRCDREGIPDPDIICGKSHDPAKKGAVCAVSTVGFGKGAVKGEGDMRRQWQREVS